MSQPAEPEGEASAGKGLDSLDAFLERKRGQEEPFRTECELARGGMGAVLVAEDQAIRRTVAVKVMRPEIAESGEHRLRFLEEAQVTGQLEHPNIVPIHDLGKDAEGNFYFSMKLVKGRSLAEILAEQKSGRASRKDAKAPGEDDQADSSLASGHWPLTELLGVFLKVCDGMAFAHSKGVIHRDLKPANIMVGDYGEVLVMDWGLAKVVGEKGRGTGDEGQEGEENLSHQSSDTGPESGTRSPEPEISDAVRSVRSDSDLAPTLDGSVAGTPAYMPPEQAEGDIAGLDGRSDIYSLGAILYEILTLKRPVEGKTTAEVVRQVTQGKVVPPERRAPDRDVARELSAIAMKCLARDPGARYQSVTELRGDITLYQEGRSVSAAPDTLLQGLWKLLRRNRGVSATAGIAAALLLALASYSFVRILSERDAALEQKARAQRNETLALSAKKEAERSEKEALAAKGEVIRNATVTAKKFSKQALRMLDEGRMKEAKLRAEDAISVCRSAPFGWYAKAMIAQAEGDHKGAIGLFRKALDLGPGHTDSKLAMGRSQQLLGQWDETVDEYVLETGLLPDERERGADLAEGEPGAMDQELGTIDLNAGRAPDEAAPTIEASSTDWRAVLRFADSLFDAARYARAEQAYGRAMQMMEDGNVGAFRIEDCARRRETARVKADCFAWYPKRDALTGADKAEEVIAKLTEINDKTGPWTFELEGARVTAIKTERGGFLKYLDPLRDMKLRSLTLEGCPELSDLTPLRGMALKQLSLKGCKSVTNLSPLMGMPLEDLGLTSTGVTDLGYLKGMPLESLKCNFTEVANLSPLEGAPLRHLELRFTSIVDLAPLRGMRLTHLALACSRGVKDLGPLKGMPLEDLSCYGDRGITDLAPLRGMPLKRLQLTFAQVRDLRALTGMPLEILECGNTQVHDLAPLRGMPLKCLYIENTEVRDFSPLAGMRLEKLSFTPDKIAAGMGIILGMKSLEQIGLAREALMPSEAFWRARGQQSDPSPRPARSPQPVTEEETGEATRPGAAAERPPAPVPRTESANGTRQKVSESQLEALRIAAAKADDWLSVLRYADAALEFGQHGAAEEAYGRAMHSMEQQGADRQWIERCESSVLRCRKERERARARARCADWYRKRDKLRGTDEAEAVIRKLRECNGGAGEWEYEIEDDRIVSMSGKGGDAQHLDPLKGLRLSSLSITGCGELWDLSPLRGMPLTDLTVASGRLQDLSPLQGMPLKRLTIRGGEDLTDISALQGMPLESLTLEAWLLRDLSGLRDLPLTRLWLRCGNPDISPLATLSRLRSLQLLTYSLGTLEPLRGLKIEHLVVSGGWLSNLYPLSGMPLTSLDLAWCPTVTGLAPLKHLPLQEFHLRRTWPQIVDPSPVEHLPILRVRDSVASVYLKFGKYDKAKKLYFSMAEKWPGCIEAFHGIRLLAQVNIQQATPKSVVTKVIEGDPDRGRAHRVQPRGVKQTPLAATSLDRARELCDYLVENWRGREHRCISRMLRARVSLERMQFPAARRELVDLLREWGLAKAEKAPCPEAIAAAYLLGESLRIGADSILPGETDLGLPPTPQELVQEDGVATEREPLRLGETEVVLTIHSKVAMQYFHARGAESQYGAEIRLEETPSAGLFFIACRHLLRGEKPGALQRLEGCVEADPESSYAKQAARMLAKMAR